ncbi:MAG: SurA N-terminal domain-containing protein [Deltaproteobacteria bacterium]|nr:SurA N-terminal domain-containing protein [Deltaproteobacteria bacterium]
MLDTLRQHSRSIFIYLIFGILILVFIISFGPQSGSSSAGCAPKSSHVATVAGHDISENSWRFGLLNMRDSSAGRGRALRARLVMDMLIERELLAQAAEQAGFQVSEEEANERIAKGDTLILGSPGFGQFVYFKNGVFDYDSLVEYTKRLSLPSVVNFVNEQKRELLAQKMRDTLGAAVKVSPEEVLEEYRQQNTKASIEFVKFEPKKHARTLAVTPADIDALLASKEEEVKKRFEMDKNLYKGRTKEIRIRQIFIKSEKPLAEAPATQPAEPNASVKATGGADPKAARKKADAIYTRLQAGEDFAKLARETSDEERTAKRGGDLGWRPIIALGEPEIAKAVEVLEPGQGAKSMSGVIETSRGFHIVKVEGRREGDLTYDQVKRDIAEEMARDEKAKALARSEAEEALAKAKAGTPLDQQFEREKSESENESAEDVPPVPSLPKLGDDRPKLFSSDEVRRNGSILAGLTGNKYLGKSAELARAVFDEIKPGELGPKVFETDDALVVVKVVKRDEPNMEEFEKQKEALSSALAGQKAENILKAWTMQRCDAAKAKGEISVSGAYLEQTEIDEKAGGSKSSYQPCSKGGSAGMMLGGLPF